VLFVFLFDLVEPQQFLVSSLRSRQLNRPK
jgi:hypothetical protein